MRDRILRAFAGTMVLVSLALGIWLNQNWFWLTAFVGVNLLQASMTKWCFLDTILQKLKVEN